MRSQFSVLILTVFLTCMASSVARAGLLDMANLVSGACAQMLKDQSGLYETAQEKGVAKINIKDGYGIRRPVKYVLPDGEPPEGGWPVVVFSQGTGFPVQFYRPDSDPAGIYYESVTVQTLIENGFAVVAPLALAGSAWFTNYIGFKHIYESSPDYELFNRLFEAIDAGDFGPLNGMSVFATGISSGGYNSSRLAMTYPERIKAIAVQSGSYATCMGPICSIPKALPENHAPTLLIGGGKDFVVPFTTTEKYYNRLQANGVTAEIYKSDNAGHEWLPESAELILTWFKKYLD